MTPADGQKLRLALLAHANPGGGWGYYPGKTSRLEPTCWALLALGADAKDFDPDPHWRFLTGCQRPSGLLAENAALPANLAFNALAAVALQSRPAFRSDRMLGALLVALATRTGRQVAQSPHFRQDNSLRGWSWIEGTFSWVEPTCWALIALKRAQANGISPRDGVDRIDEAERMLIDRCCREGGWNYGNANALGKELFAYIPVTALALLAIRNRRDLDVVTRSLRFLQEQWDTEESTISLGLTSACFRRFGIATDKVDQALALQVPVALDLNNVHAIAAALYAATPPSSDDALTI